MHSPGSNEAPCDVLDEWFRGLVFLPYEVGLDNVNGCYRNGRRDVRIR